MDASPVHLVPLKEAVAPLRIEHRARIRAVARWSLGAGRPVPSEHVALIIGARTVFREEEDIELDHWTRTGVYHHLRCDMFNWCNLHRALIPEGLPESLWTYLHYLDAEGVLAPGSNPLIALLDPLRCYGGLKADGTRAKRGGRVVCRCFVEYRPDEAR